MKHTVIIVILTVFSSLALSAQVKLGGKLAYGSEIKSIGIGAKGIYELNDTFSLSGELLYFLGDKEESSILGISTETKTSSIALNTDLHYNLLDDTFKVYALGGLNFVNFSSKVTTSSTFGIGGLDVDSSGTFIGLNLGIGGLYEISDNLNLVSELKYVLGDFDQVVLSAGVLFNL